MIQNLRMVFPSLLFLSSQICAMDVSSRTLDCVSPDVRAYVERQRTQYKIVATILTKRGEIIDWIDPLSQLPDSEWATNPRLRDDWTRPPTTAGEIEDGGPPGTVPILWTNPEHACGLTLQEWLDQIGRHGHLDDGLP